MIILSRRAVGMMVGVMLTLSVSCGMLGGLLAHASRSEAAALERESETRAALAVWSTRYRAVYEVERHIAKRAPHVGAVERRGYAELLVEAARGNDLKPSLVTGVALVESNLDPQARSEKDAIGIMQIVPYWWVGKAPGIATRQDLYDPVKNIHAGAWILAHYKRACGPVKMLACYESGMRALDTGYTGKVLRASYATREAI